MLNKFNAKLQPFYIATIVGFSKEVYSVPENESLRVSVYRSGDTESHIVVLIASHPNDGTATGIS